MAFFYLVALFACPARITQTSANLPDVDISYVNNSGICETTPGVQQMSGYISVGKNMNMWFWFFEARNSPETAPFTLWLNGGPGCSSMIGLFQENGPCHVNADLTTTINPYSWNNLSNMIYIDQPIGTGFSYGTDTVNSTESAAPFVWTAFQMLFETTQFAKFESREFIFATESYGGHYGPSFVTYFDQQNSLIQSGAIQGEQILVSALMINNGWYDPLLQNKAYVDFATDAPGYGQLQSDEVIAKLNEAFYGSTGCQAQEQACYDAGNSSASNNICNTADNFCRDSDDLRQNSSALFPPEYYVDYLQQASIQSAIGAEAKYSECPDAPYELFTKTGDDARTWLPQLGALADSKLKLLIWAGDADINSELANTSFTNMTIDGTSVAAVQNVDNFSFARVYASGHEVPAFQPVAALEIFKQIINMEQLHSV
ncbi:alpha/beta-hydrolase [Lentinula aff. lateritia]|uniref:Alpha/beta-hydrolase n=1 Tax=Lentinula aff. lateritia TaxID=2804960 RepID=A0ACC1U6E5_9AGAR|nr:alpha/beta-hydrolase [Lentinula aff. lateritia]